MDAKTHETMHRRLRATYVDKSILALDCLFKPQIHAVLEFEGTVERGRMARALRLMCDAEPVLGCRFVPRWIRPYWERLPDSELDSARLLWEGAPADEAGFLGAELAELGGPQHAALVVDTGRGDRMIFKVNHQIADAGGVKEYLYRLAELYRLLGSDQGHRPVPNPGSRSLRQVYGRFLPRSVPHLLRRHAADQMSALRPFISMRLQSGDRQQGSPRFVVRSLGPERFAAMSRYADGHGATINDLLVTATLRGLARLTGYNGESALRLVGTVDLRRYLPSGRGEALCNLSSFMFQPNLGLDLGEDFERTLGEVKRQIDAVKADMIGLPFMLATWLVVWPMPYSVMRRFVSGIFLAMLRSGNAPVAMTNMGRVDDGRLDMGGPKVAAVRLLCPPSGPPAFVFGVSSFFDSLTLSAGIYESAERVERVERLFSLIEEELSV